MSESTSHRSSFHRDTYEGSADGLVSLLSAMSENDVQTVAKEALRRLAARARRSHPADDGLPSPEEIDRLCRALTDEDPEAGARYIDAIVGRGVSKEDIYLNYLASAARRMGELWEADEASFFAVTVGTSRIFAILRALDGRGPKPPLKEGRQAFFAAVPGETHLLGIRMAADLFRQRGWEIELAIDLSHEALIDRIALSGHHVIGLSAASAAMAPALARAMVALRAQDPDSYILISGQILVDARGVVDTIMPDGVAQDVATAEMLLEAACER